ncbi:sensor domain-containing protein [Haloprofundus salilacus]|uniref:sensor domain-containing protein n=1 Tax=Haloprofundus salilacus TaxID=2876190 RepID=UPI001CCF7BE8|nr:sensor domain-containing protein [Haloprofundus salilacus]
MTTPLTSNDAEPGSPVDTVLRTPLQPQTYRNLVYLVLMFPLGNCYFMLLTVGFLTGVSLIPLGIGVPIVLAFFVLAIELARLERRLVQSLLGVETPASTAKTDGSLWTRTKRLVTALQTWKSIVYLLSEFVYATLVFGLLASAGATSMSFLLAPFYYTEAPVTAYGPIPTTDVTLDILFGWDSLLIGLTTTFQLGSWQIGSLFGAVLVAALGVSLLFVTLLFSNVAAQLWGQYAQRMLTTPRYWTTPTWYPFARR